MGNTAPRVPLISFSAVQGEQLERCQAGVSLNYLCWLFPSKIRASESGVQLHKVSRMQLKTFNNKKCPSRSGNYSSPLGWVWHRATG